MYGGTFAWSYSVSIKRVFAVTVLKVVRKWLKVGFDQFKTLVYPKTTFNPFPDKFREIDLREKIKNLTQCRGGGHFCLERALRQPLPNRCLDRRERETLLGSLRSSINPHSGFNCKKNPEAPAILFLRSDLIFRSCREVRK